MEFDRVTMDILRPAADTLRRALRRMDEEDVPAALRSVADSSARKLPPPLLKRALVELDRSDWLREEVSAEGDLEADSASRLFVDRPDGWQEKLEAGARSAADREESVRSAELERKLAQAQERIDLLESRLDEASKKIVTAEERGRARMRTDLEVAQKGRRQAERQARDEATEAARVFARAERLQAELDVHRTRVDTLRSLLEKERRSATSSPEVAQVRGWFPADPQEMAAELDRIQLAIRRTPLVSSGQPADGPNGGGSVPERLPTDLRPDRVEIIPWLMQYPFQWLIDGYNVAFQVSGEPGAVTRERLVVSAASLAALANPGSMVVVVFDSSVDTSSLPADRRVRVVFAPSADEWILEHARPGSVVVSSDRRVREGAETKAALGVWSEALAAWISAGGNVGSRPYPDG